GLAAAGLPGGTAVLKINNRKLLDGLFDAHGVEDVRQRLTALRAIDKFDRLGLAGVGAPFGAGRVCAPLWAPAGSTSPATTPRGRSSAPRRPPPCSPSWPSRTRRTWAGSR